MLSYKLYWFYRMLLHKNEKLLHALDEKILDA